MSASELSIRQSENPAELRVRYNQLCAALTAMAGTNSLVADRVLQELQTLAQKIAFRQAERTRTDQPAASTAPAPKPARAPAASSNVIAFRCKVKGVLQENPRLSAALSALADRAPLFPVARDKPAAAAPAPLAAQPTPVLQADAGPSPVAAAVAEQSSELDRLARQSEEQSQAIERFERQLGTSGPLSTLSIQVAALRAATTRQGDQLVTLATSVHRLAKLLAAHAP